MSVLDDILNACQSTVAALNLQLNAVVVPVVVRMAVKKAPSVDPATLITVSSDPKGERVKAWGFGGNWRLDYTIDLTIVTPNNDDYLTNLDTFTQWRQQIRNTFQTWVTAPVPTKPLATVPAVWDLKVKPEALFPPGELQDNYSNQKVTLLVSANETPTT